MEITRLSILVVGNISCVWFLASLPIVKAFQTPYFSNSKKLYHLGIGNAISKSTLIHISEGKKHDADILDMISFLPDCFYILDRGYLDFDRLYRIHKAGAFLSPAPKRVWFWPDVFLHLWTKKRVSNVTNHKIFDFYASKDYPEKLRRIKFYDSETDKTLIFPTNYFEFAALEIARLYKHWWFIEIVFK